MKRLALYASISLATVLAVLFLYRFRLVLAILVASLALAAAARPIIASLVARGLSHLLAVALVYLSALLLLVGLLAGLGAMLSVELPQLGEDVARTYEQLHPAWRDGSAWQQMVAGRLPSPETFYESIGGANGELFARQLLRLTRRLLTVIGLLLLTVIISLYWSIDQVRLERLWLSFLSPKQRALAQEIGRGLGRGVGGYVRSEGAQSLLALLALTAGYHLLDLPYPTILALLGALGWLVPFIGVFLALPPLVAVGLVSGLTAAAAAVLYTLALFAALEYIVEPRLRQHRRFNPILTLLAMLLVVDSFGLLGLLLAPPLAIAVQIILSYTVGRRPDGARADGAAPQLGDLRQSLGELRSTLAGMEGQARPEMSSLVGRLEDLLQLAEARRDTTLDADRSPSAAP